MQLADTSMISAESESRPGSYEFQTPVESDISEVPDAAGTIVSETERAIGCL
jgi:hypothetical protein